MPEIDLNCDLGEGAGRDDELMPWITSASIACGGHAGDEASMRRAVRRASECGVIIGAHPGFADRANFGRRELALSAGEIGELVAGQVGALMAIAREEGAQVRFVKPHGALYNLAARDAVVAEAIAGAVAAVGASNAGGSVAGRDASDRPDAGLAIYGLSGGELLVAGRRHGLAVKSEVFADRTYQRDGTLTRRDRPGALIDDEARAVAQVLGMVREGRAFTPEGAGAGEDAAARVVSVVADTLCLHGDGAHAVQFARRLREVLRREGVRVRACVERFAT